MSHNYFILKMLDIKEKSYRFFDDSKIDHHQEAVT